MRFVICYSFSTLMFEPSADTAFASIPNFIQYPPTHVSIMSNKCAEKPHNLTKNLHT